MEILDTSGLNHELDLQSIGVELLGSTIGIGSQGSTNSPLSEVFLQINDTVELLLEVSDLGQSLLAEESVQGTELVTFKEISFWLTSESTTIRISYLGNILFRLLVDSSVSITIVGQERHFVKVLVLRNVLFKVFKETSGDLLFLLNEFGTAIFVEELSVSGVDVGHIEDLVESELSELFLVDTADTV